MAVSTDTNLAPSTEVEPLSPQLREALVRAAGTSVSLSDLFTEFATEWLPEATRPEASAVRPVSDTDVEKATAALLRAKELYGKVAPADERELTEKELVALLEERQAIDSLKKSVGVFSDRKDQSLRNTVLIHMDRYAERTGQVVPDGEEATPRDSQGHYLKEMKVPVPGTDWAFSWEVGGGKADVDSSRLLAAYEAGKITRAEYLSLTKETRVYDQRRALDALAKNPELFIRLARHATTTKPQTGSLYVRKA